jgi:F-type H+-transporting ATPase subunit delta
VTDSVTYSRPYAEAAYKIAVESNVTSLWADNLMILSEVIKDAEVKAIIASPRVDDNKSLSFLNSFLGKEDTSFSNFLSIMINNKKIYFIDEVYKLFNDMLLKDQEITVAEIETAFALTESQKENLSKSLMKQHAQKVLIKEVINQDLLAGIKISVNNEVTDYSIRNKLNLMKEQIINNR